jgi:proline racemase
MSGQISDGVEPDIDCRLDKSSIHVGAIDTVDYHTGGEPFRIVLNSKLPIPGQSAAERLILATEDSEVDRLRRMLCHEPRGHAGMFGGFLTPPDNPGADFGALFWHADGFSAACGHGTIALGVWAIESGRVIADPSGTTDVTIDVPSGRVVARVHANGEHITEVDFINVPSYALATDVEIATSRGKVIVDVGYAGSNYVHLRAADVGLSVTRDNINELVDIGRELKTLMSDTLRTQPSARSGRSGIYGTIIFDEIDEIDEDESGNLHQRNVTIFADGAFDRSPCGSGSASRIAVLDAREKLRHGAYLTHESIVGSLFTCSIMSRTTADGFDAVVARITGMAYRTGSSHFTADPADPLASGFVVQ